MLLFLFYLLYPLLGFAGGFAGALLSGYSAESGNIDFTIYLFAPISIFAIVIGFVLGAMMSKSDENEGADAVSESNLGEGIKRECGNSNTNDAVKIGAVLVLPFIFNFIIYSALAG